MAILDFRDHVTTIHQSLRNLKREKNMMIRRLTGTMFRQLSIGLVLLATALTMVIWLVTSLRFVDMIINKGATLGIFIRLTLLSVPSYLPTILPIALFIIIVFVYSKLTSDRELVVMSASGLSPLQLSKPVLMLCGLVMLLTYSINLFFLPESYRMFGELKWHLRYNYSQVLLDDGKFNTIGDRTTVYISERESDNSLKGIFYHDETDSRSAVTIMAKRGSLVKTDKGAQIVMFDGNRQERDVVTKNYSVLFFDRYVLSLDRYNEKKSYRTPDSRELTVPELFDVASNTIIPERDYPKYIVEGHKRLVLPLVPVAFSMIALVCLYAGGFTRRNQTKRIVFAALIMLVLQISILAAGNMSARNLALVPSLYILVLAPIVAGFVMLIWPPRLRFLN
jgi:lipopolysaccharide export system permease protein